MENIKIMKVKDLKKELNKYDDELDICITFALVPEDENGHHYRSSEIMLMGRE